MSDHSSAEQDDRSPGTGLWAWWHRTPLYIRILVGMVLGVIVGVVFKEQAEFLSIPSKLVLRLLGALAPPLVLVAIIHALMTADIRGKIGRKLVGLLLLNTLVAICIGLLVANVVQPGRSSHLKPPPEKAVEIKSQDPLAPRINQFLKDNGYKPEPAKPDTISQMLENVPQSLLGPLADNGRVIGVIFLALAFGFALRKHRNTELRTVEDFTTLAMNCLVTILHWIIEIVPLAVFGIVASIIGTKGFAAFHALGLFVISVIVALLLQACYYLIRVHLGSWVRPLDLVRGLRDALVMAFSTGSSTITMPVTYDRLKTRVGIRERSASMGSLVGANFNNDGTALYEAMAALFISQMLGQDLSFQQQLLVVLTSVVASVGAAGIPEAGLVTMTLVFHSVHLPTEYIAILLTTDWFLDRCRTVINVMGDLNVSCLLDGRTPPTPEERAEQTELATV